MGIGTGIFLIAAGAILYWAVDFDLPYVTDDALGLILALTGVAVLGVAVVMRANRPEAGVGTGVLLLAGGAILIWAVNADLPYIDDDALGTILMVAGAVTVIATLIMNVVLRRRQEAALAGNQPPPQAGPQQPQAYPPEQQPPYTSQQPPQYGQQQQRPPQ